MKRVGVPNGDFCYIGILDEEHEVPCAEHLKGQLCYVNLIDGRFIVAFKNELYFI